jgi:hypothetical protein
LIWGEQSFTATSWDFVGGKQLAKPARKET